MTQGLQVVVQKRIIGNVLAAQSGTPIGFPLPLRLLRRWAWLRRIPALIVGLGFRPEHVRVGPVSRHVAGGDR